MDPGRAVRYYRLAGAQGYAAAHFNLAVLYESGQGVVKDLREAVRLFTLAGQGERPGRKLATERPGKDALTSYNHHLSAPRDSRHDDSVDVQIIESAIHRLDAIDDDQFAQTISSADATGDIELAHAISPGDAPGDARLAQAFSQTDALGDVHLTHIDNSPADAPGDVQLTQAISPYDAPGDNKHGHAISPVDAPGDVKLTRAIFPANAPKDNKR